jgi:hypothetical protein
MPVNPPRTAFREPPWLCTPTGGMTAAPVAGAPRCSHAAATWRRARPKAPELGFGARDAIGTTAIGPLRDVVGVRRDPLAGALIGVDTGVASGVRPALPVGLVAPPFGDAFLGGAVLGVALGVPPPSPPIIISAIDFRRPRRRGTGVDDMPPQQDFVHLPTV